ncbi:hypothetical protein U1769_01575 [Sphingomonas sp. ZT3P38]|uniref:hypothetical protein n=1 Tax=Parasphingomonas zepuensis TaxID=3096161 RepID=UPI002FC78C57
MPIAFAVLALIGMDGDNAVPSSRTIARIESGIVLLDQLQIVGVADTTSMNRMSRVRVRAAACRAEVASKADCTYQVDHCRESEEDSDHDGWCGRQTRFVRADAPSL